MKRIFSTLCLLALFATAVAAQQNGSIQDESLWQRYTIKGEDFSVKLPLLPDMTTTDVYRFPGQRERRERRLAVYADGVVYTFYSLDDANFEKAYQETLDGIRSGKRWDLNSERDLKGAGFAGKQYFSKAEVGETVQVFVTKKRYYRFEAFGAAAEDPRVKPFLASIMIGKKGEGIEVSDGQGAPYQPGAQSTVPVFIDNFYKSNEVDRKAVVITRPEPQYTEEARQNKLTGAVVLKAVFSATGSVISIRTISGLPFGLTEQALKAAHKIKFIPAMKDGKFVSMWMELEYHFNLY